MRGSDIICMQLEVSNLLTTVTTGYAKAADWKRNFSQLCYDGERGRIGQRLDEAQAEPKAQASAKSRFTTALLFSHKAKTARPDYQREHEERLCRRHSYFPHAVYSTITAAPWRWMCSAPRQQQDNPRLSCHPWAFIHAWTSLWIVNEIIIGNLKEFARQSLSPIRASLHKDYSRLNWLKEVYTCVLRPNTHNLKDNVLGA